MLTITVPKGQFWDEKNNKFVYSNETVLKLEHSLIAISKWESRYHKPYLTTVNKTESEARYYLKCMTVNNVSDDKVYWALTADNIEAISKYIHDSMTASAFKKVKKTDKKDKKENTKDKKKTQYEECYTSEYIYYLMIAYGVPHEYEKWHIERLLTLLRICREEAEKQNNVDKKKETTRTTPQQLDRMAALNERRKAELHTRG